MGICGAEMRLQASDCDRGGVFPSRPTGTVRCGLSVNCPQPGSFDPFAAVNERIGDYAPIENRS
jgi:hypothetical protein